jgi:hypothetical protein
MMAKIKAIVWNKDALKCFVVEFIFRSRSLCFNRIPSYCFACAPKQNRRSIAK